MYQKKLRRNPNTKPYPSYQIVFMFLNRYKKGGEDDEDDDEYEVKKLKTEKTIMEVSKSAETVNASKHTLKTSESTVSKKLVSEKKKKIKKKKKGDEDDEDDDEYEEKKIKTEKTTIELSKTHISDVKSVLEIMQTKCPYVLPSIDGKKCLKRCCCQFIKSLPPTPRETFRNNPGNPHFYPGPGFKHRWGYTVQLQRLQRLEEERQRLCAEQRGIPYVGPERQYQDFFDDTPMEVHCCCDSCINKKNKEADPNSFECNVADPHFYPRVAGFRQYFDNKEKIRAVDKILEDLRKECEEVFPDIKPLAKAKVEKSGECRGAIVSGQKDKELKIKEIVERMAAICSCLDDCDCKAALQAREPYLNENQEACCCSRDTSGRVNETFDCNAGDPHLYPTVAAFKHAFEFKREKKDRIAKRKSIYDEIVQHGTETEIQEARISLYKQIIEDGSKEEQEEARVSLAQEEARVSVESTVTQEKEPSLDGECDCPEIQEIVIMIEDSDCDEEPIFNPYAHQGIPEFEQTDIERETWLPEYSEVEEDWGQVEEFEPMESSTPEAQAENNTLQTQTPPDEQSLSKSVTSHTQAKKTFETETPRTSQNI